MILPVSEAQFFSEFWQQKPLLCPQAFADFSSPITPEELAGLAMESSAESRLVWQRGGVWQQQLGPFNEDDFQREGPWTLLVQRVDHWFDEVSALRKDLPQIPQWRFDDVMVSYATDGAGVGPHFDRYDVFLLQGSGRREWRLGPHCDDNTPQLSENELSLIPPFESEDTFILEPGDVLYVPPGVAHWGIARGPCMTYSLGFRAPSIANLLARRVDRVLECLSDSALLEDGLAATLPTRPGEITAAHIANARDAMHNAIDALDDQLWLGEVVTEINEDSGHAPPPIDTQLMHDALQLHPEHKVAWMERRDRVDLFVDGTHFEIPLSELSYAISLCSGDSCDRTALADKAAGLYEILSDTGALTAHIES